MATHRGVLGYQRSDRRRLLEEQAEIARALQSEASDLGLQSRFADRLFKIGDGAAAVWGWGWSVVSGPSLPAEPRTGKHTQAHRSKEGHADGSASKRAWSVMRQKMSEAASR